MDTALGTIIWAVCLVALGLALWRPHAGRLVLGTLFVVTAVGGYVAFVVAARSGSLDFRTAAPPLSPWWVFERVVAEAPVALSLLVAGYGVAIGLMMIRGGRWGSLGLAGGIVLLLIIAPLAPWTAPTLIMVVGLGAILVRDARVQSSLRGVESAPSAAGRTHLGDDGAQRGMASS